MTTFHSTILLLVSVIFCCYPVVPELRGASVLDKKTPPVRSPIPPPQANPNALKSTTPVIPKEPAFEIGYIIPAREGFQKCTTPNGYVVSITNLAADVTSSAKNWPLRYCAKGNVTVTQINPITDMTGKMLRLYVVHNEIGWFYNTPWDRGTIDIYELPFQQRETLTFQVVFASGWKPNLTTNDPVKENLEYVSNAFLNPAGVGFFAQYLDPKKKDESTVGAYPALICSFTSRPAGSVPPRTNVDCPSGMEMNRPFQPFWK
jgi:hypothetical protein